MAGIIGLLEQEMQASIQDINPIFSFKQAFIDILSSLRTKILLSIIHYT
jgi:hypothetical protein